MGGRETEAAKSGVGDGKEGQIDTGEGWLDGCEEGTKEQKMDECVEQKMQTTEEKSAVTPLACGTPSNLFLVHIIVLIASLAPPTHSGTWRSAALKVSSVTCVELWRRLHSSYRSRRMNEVRERSDNH